MSLVVLYLATVLLFLVIDYVGLSYLLQPAFKRDIGHLMRDSFRAGAAAAFYLFFVAVLLWFVSWPALQESRTLLWVFGNGMLLGAMAYGTYEFTSFAILKDWTWRLVLLDVCWGTLATGAIAVAGVATVRLLGLS